MKLLFFLAAAAALVSAAPKPDGPDPRHVYIESVTHGGTGCPSNSVSNAMNGERTTFTLMFDKYVAVAKPGASPAEARKDCQINVNLRFPPGYSYTVATIDYRGYLQLASGHTGQQSSIIYFAGSPVQARFSTSRAGPFAGDYHLRDALHASAWVWSPCGARVPVNIKTAISLNSSANRQGSSLMTTDSIDGKVSHIHGVTWKGC